MVLNSLNIGIIGLGAMGTLWASRLAPYHNLYALPRYVNNKEVLNRKLIHLDSTEENLELTIWNSDSPQLDIILVCTKASATVAAITQWQSSMSPQCQIILMQNGMGQHEQVCQQFPTQSVFAASTTEGAFKPSETMIVHAGSGQTTWGAVENTSNSTALTLDLSTIAGKQILTNDIHQILLDKLAINAVINPLTVYHDCKNGELVNELAYHQNLVNLANEVEQFLEKKGKTLSFCLAEKATEVATLTGNNTSSMRQDVLAKRQTEIDYISGYLLELATSSEQKTLLPMTSKYYEYVTSLDIN